MLNNNDSSVARAAKIINKNCPKLYKNSEPNFFQISRSNSDTTVFNINSVSDCDNSIDSISSVHVNSIDSISSVHQCTCKFNRSINSVHVNSSETNYSMYNNSKFMIMDILPRLIENSSKKDPLKLARALEIQENKVGIINVANRTSRIPK
ncbi:hypothetical protein PIROE2DRAFT_8824 [Piromyces sp. E2]|nr:hypothetical protein PIROE2DRAFT_8824 [Piromyces sp. E2]|eukprot:OUM64434.1 hypothetical protein PIROE2DRAFT_8824 [Piromyces sp. E2]